METFSALLALCVGNSPVTGEFPSQRPVTRSFDVYLICALNKRLSKQSWDWWFETPSCSLWRHCNVMKESLTRRCDTGTLFTSLTLVSGIHRSTDAMRNFDVFFGISLNKLLNKLFICRWFGTAWPLWWGIKNIPYTVRCRYKAVNFIQNPHNKHPISRPWGRDVGCLLRFWYLIRFLSLL